MPGTDFGTDPSSFVIFWGDGTSNNFEPSEQFGFDIFGTAPGLTGYVDADHVYDKPGDYQIKVVIADKGGSETEALSEAIIAPVPPQPPPTVDVIESIPYRLKPPTPIIQILGNFAVPATPSADSSAYQAMVDWGDGSPGSPDVSPAAVSLVGGDGTTEQVEITGSHDYTETGTFDGTITVTTLGQSPVTADFTATVTDLPIAAQGVPVAPRRGRHSTRSWPRSPIRIRARLRPTSRRPSTGATRRRPTSARSCGRRAVRRRPPTSTSSGPTPTTMTTAAPMPRRSRSRSRSTTWTTGVR